MTGPQDGRHNKTDKQPRGQTWEQARALYLQNVPVSVIARSLGVSRARIYQCLKGLIEMRDAAQD